MKRQRIIKVLSLMFVLTFLISLSHAEEKKIKLKPGKEMPKAEGEVEIKDEMGKKKVHLTVELRPNAVYTVWLVNEKPKMDMAGLGAGDYSFKTDGKGEGHYFATISADDLGKWQIMKIAYHPDGDAKNMKGIKIDLEGMLK